MSDGGDGDNSAAGAVREASGKGVGLLTMGIGDEGHGALVPESSTDRTPVMFGGSPVRTRLNAAMLRDIALASDRGA